MSISRKIAIVVVCAGAFLSLGIIIALSGKWSSDGRFDSYQSARIDRRAEFKISELRETASGTEESLDFVEFPTVQVGWIGNHYGLLFDTRDGGRTWNRRSLKFAGQDEHLYYPAIHFVSDVSGWAIAQRYNAPGEDICLRNAWLLHTDDGGSTWNVQFEKKCVELIRLSFVSDREGWLVGQQFFQEKQTTTGKFLVMHTSDGGKTWVDVSARPNWLMGDLRGRVLELPAGIAASSDGSATMISGNGYLLDASNGGTRWQRSGSLALYRLLPETKAMSDGSVTVNAGVDGEEGTAGMVARRDANGQWTGSWFKDFLVNDAVFLSDREIVACGSLLPEDKALLVQGQREAAIICSSDGGLNWKLLFKSSEVKSVNALHAGDGGTVWAVGPHGKIIKLMWPIR